MCEILAFLETGCSILLVAYYERSWRFCGYRCVSKEKLTGWRSGYEHAVLLFPRGKDRIPQQKGSIRIWIQL